MSNKTRYVLAVSLLCLASCKQENQPEYWTVFEFEVIAGACRHLTWDDVGNITDYNGLLPLLKRKGGLQKTERAQWDGRGAPFQYIAIKDRESQQARTIRVISCGPNGVFEGGMGDDS